MSGKKIHIQLRKGFFETNSSSTHAISIPTNAPLDDQLPFDEDGRIRIEPDSFQWEWNVYHDSYTKASYCLTYAIIALERKNTDKYLKMLEEVIREETGMDVILVIDKERASIDHQSLHVAEKLFHNKETLRRFIFSSAAYLVTGNDNDEPPPDMTHYFLNSERYYVAEALLKLLDNDINIIKIDDNHRKRLMEIKHRVEELKKIAENATPGPWTIKHRDAYRTANDDASSVLGLEISEIPKPSVGQFSKAADAQLASSASEMLGMFDEIFSILSLEETKKVED